MATATINGIEIAYADEGTGTPVVFIHGYPLNRTMWDDQVSGLAGRVRTITVDLRGHGRSQAPIWTTSVDIYADDVIKLLDHLAIEKAVVCGLSMGGYVTFAIARQAPERLHAVILADTRAQADTPEGKQGRFQAALTAQAQGARAIADSLLPRLLCAETFEKRPEVAVKMRQIIESTPVQGICGDLVAMAERPDAIPQLPSISVPALVVVGDQDALTPPADSELIASKIPGARLAVIAGSGHMSPMEQPAAFNNEVAAFLSSLSL